MVGVVGKHGESGVKDEGDGGKYPGMTVGRMTETNLIAGFLNYPQRQQDLPRLLSPRHQELRGKAEAANLAASLRAGYSRTSHALWIE